MSSPSIAFFDVDKTLCDGYSGYFTTRELIRKGILKKSRLVKAVLYRAIGPVLKKMDVRRMYEIVLADLAGQRAEDLLQLGLEIFERDVKPRLYIEGLHEIDKMKSEGHAIVLISSGPTMLIKNMESFLKAETSFSIGPRVEQGVLLETIAEPLCYGPGKVTLAKRFADEKGLALKDCFYYADSYADLGLLEEVGHPRVVNPDKHLLRTAKRKKWPILYFEHTLEDSRP